MNIKEYWKAVRSGEDVRHYDIASREIQKSLKYNQNPEATVRHHLRDTEEQRKYNDEHYELWGFEIDEDGNEHFEYGKYMIFVTHDEHSVIHALSEETREKISESVKLAMTPGHRQKLSAIAKAGMSDERRAIISETTKNAMKDPVIRKKISYSKIGKPLSEEHKKAIGAGGTGRVVSNETRDKISKIHKGKVVSDETRKKLSESNKAAWENAEYRERMSKAFKDRTPWNKGVPMSDEQKLKLRGKKSDAHKESLKKSMAERTSAYYEYKECHPDIKWAYFLKNIWPMIKDSHVG